MGTTATATAALMTDRELTEFVELLNEAANEGCYTACPHCDAPLHGETRLCWCAGCDACDRARAAAAREAAMLAEYERRFPAPTPAPVPAAADNEPF